MAPWRRAGLLVILALLPVALRAQIIDDTTRVLFGPRTTLVVREANVLRNLPDGAPLDTTINGIQQSRNWVYDSTFQQNLGTLGTASRRLLWEVNTNIGARLGRDVFNRYFRSPNAVPYYDTRSPFSFFRFIQGGAGESVFEGSYSRSIKKTANLGIVYERISSNKQLAPAFRDDGLTRHTNLLLFGRYQTRDNRYQMLAHYYTGRHEAAEQGGIRPGTGDRLDSLEGLFSYNLEAVRLTNATNTDNRDRFHLAHTYNLVGRGLTAFHVLDWSRQYNRYLDEALRPLSDTTQFYPAQLLSNRRTDDRTDYGQVENTGGLLGRTDFLEYRLYGRVRNWSLDTRNNTTDSTGENLKSSLDRSGTQLFAGGSVAFRWKKIFDVEAAGEYKFFDEYWLRGSMRFGPLRAELLSSAYAPSLTETYTESNHYRWDNRSRFSNTLTNQLTVSFNQRIGGAQARVQQQLLASIAVTNINNLVFYNQLAEPEQLNTGKQLLIGTLRHQLRYGVLHTDNQVVVTQGGDGEGLRIPAVVANLKVYAEGYLFKRALFSQIGLETYFQDRWQPYDYAPSIQQFYVQDYFTSRRYSVIDAFVTADIKTVSVFLKMAYINQGLYRNGYFTAPYYTGNPRNFQLGIRWNFFD